jgi:predicted lipid-binding transport protein (Tim44 family)
MELLPLTSRILKNGDDLLTMFVDAELVRADQIGDRAEVSIRFSGRYRDKSENVEEPITDIWHLERDLSKAGAPWYIVGIEA